MSNSPQSQSGWKYLNNIQANRKVRIGAASVAAAALLHASGVGEGVLDIYGKFQGRGAVQYAEMELDEVASADTVIESKANPLAETESGVVIADFRTTVCFPEYIPSPASTLDVGVTDADGEGDTDVIFNGLVPEANKCFSAVNSGSLATSGMQVVSPSSYTNSGTHITARWKTGSGQEVGDVPSGFLRVAIDPCTENVPC